MDNVSFNPDLGFQIGAQYYYQIQEQLYLRTGGLLTQRNSTYSTSLPFFGNVDNEYSLLYLDIPLTLEYRFNERLAVFGGVQMALLLSDECTASNGNDCRVGNNDYKSFILGIPVGVNLMLNPQMGFDAFYQMGMGQVASHNAGSIDWSHTFGASFIYKFL